MARSYWLPSDPIPKTALRGEADEEGGYMPEDFIDVPQIHVPWHKAYAKALRKGLIVTVPLIFPNQKIVQLLLYPDKAWKEKQTQDAQRSRIVRPS